MNLLKIPILLLFCFLFTGAETEWERYISESGSFRVLFPSEPEKQIQQVSMQAGDGYQKTKMYMFLVQEPSFTYLVVYNRMPAWNPEDADYILDKARTSAIASLNGKLISEKDIKLDSHPGREVRIKSPEQGFYYRSRMYLVDDIFYQVSVTTLAEQSASSNITRFLDSFELLSEETDN